MKVELQDNALFKSVSRKIFQSDILNKNPKKIKSRIAVFSKGQSTSSVYLLIEGKINFIDYNFMNRGKNDNKSRTIRAGEFFGYEEIVTGKKRNSAALTLIDCEIYEITVDELNSLIAQDGQILKNLNQKNSATQTAGTDPEQKKKTTKENKFYFDFRTKVDFAKEKQIKNKAEISEIVKLNKSLDEVNDIAEKAEQDEKEIEIKQIMEELVQEEVELRIAKEKEQSLLEKEQKLSTQSENPDKKKHFAEEVLKTEDKKLFEEELKKIKQKEEELAKREESLKREMELSEASLQKEVENLLLLEKEFEEKRAMIADSEKNTGTTYVQLEQFRKREEELLTRINELEKNSERKEAESEKKEPVESSGPKSEEKPGSNMPEYASVLERDYNLAFQVRNYEDVVIVFVNIQRGVAASALQFERTLDKLLKDGKMKIVVDLSFCDFLDSTFLGVLVTLLKKLNIEGGSLRVVLNAIKFSSSTFFLSGMDRVFNIQTNLTKAIHEILNEDS